MANQSGDSLYGMPIDIVKTDKEPLPWVMRPIEDLIEESIESLLSIVYGGGEAAIDACRALAAIHEWIPVSKRLPGEYVHVIGHAHGRRPSEVWRNSKGEWLGGDCEPVAGVTHWMPMPEPPTDVA